MLFDFFFAPKVAECRFCVFQLYYSFHIYCLALAFCLAFCWKQEASLSPLFVSAWTYEILFSRVYNSLLYLVVFTWEIERKFILIGSANGGTQPSVSTRDTLQVGRMEQGFWRCMLPGDDNQRDGLLGNEFTKLHHLFSDLGVNWTSSVQVTQWLAGRVVGWEQ